MEKRLSRAKHPAVMHRPQTLTSEMTMINFQTENLVEAEPTQDQYLIMVPLLHESDLGEMMSLSDLADG